MKLAYRWVIMVVLILRANTKARIVVDRWVFQDNGAITWVNQRLLLLIMKVCDVVVEVVDVDWC